MTNPRRPAAFGARAWCKPFRRAASHTPRRGLAKRKPVLTTLMLVSAMTILVGCSNPREQGVLANPPLGGTLFYRVQTDEPLDLIVWFINRSGSPVTMTTISPQSPSPAIHTVGTAIYDVRRVGYNLATAVGILPQECPREFVPRPVRSLTIAPGRESNWFGVITLRVTKPGRYLIRKIKFSYITARGPGWQYYVDPVRLIVTNPSRPGPTPIPPSDACV